MRPISSEFTPLAAGQIDFYFHINSCPYTMLATQVYIQLTQKQQQQEKLCAALVDPVLTVLS